MVSPSYKWSAPGSLMFCGEHAVLHGFPALVGAIDKRIMVTLTPDPTHQDFIIDSALGQLCHALDQPLEPKRPFHFLLKLIETYRTQLPCGFKLTITAEFSATVGFGSSSAVVVATLACLHDWLGQPTTPDILFPLARACIRAQQNGQGSGADIAASLLGGLVYFEAEPAIFRTLEIKLPQIMALYSGYKTPTTTVIAQLNEHLQQHPEKRQYFQQMGDCVTAITTALQCDDLAACTLHLQRYQQWMCDLALNNAVMDQIATLYAQHPDVLAYKISGAGLGDCVIGLCQPGTIPKIALSPAHHAQNIVQIPVAFQKTGLIKCSA